MGDFVVSDGVIKYPEMIYDGHTSGAPCNSN